MSDKLVKTTALGLAALMLASCGQQGTEGKYLTKTPTPRPKASQKTENKANNKPSGIGKETNKIDNVDHAGNANVPAVVQNNRRGWIETNGGWYNRGKVNWGISKGNRHSGNISAIPQIDYRGIYNMAKARYDRAVANYNEAFSTANEERKAELKEELGAALNNLADAKAKLDETKEIVAKALAVFQANFGVYNTEAAKVDAAVNARQKGIDEAKAALDAKQAEVTEAYAKKAEAENKLADLQNKKGVLEADLVKAKAEVTKAEGTLKTAKDALAKAQESKAEEVAAAKERLAAAEAGLSTARENKVREDGKLADLNKQLTEAKQGLKDAQDAYDAEVAAVSKQAAELKKIVAEKQGKFDSAQTSEMKAKGVLDEATAKKTTAENELRKAQDALAEVQKQNADGKLSKALDAAKARVEAAQKAYDKAQSDQVAAQTAYDEANGKYLQMVDEAGKPMDWSKLSDDQLMDVIADLVGKMVNDHRVEAGLNPLPMSHEKNKISKQWSEVQKKYKKTSHMIQGEDGKWHTSWEYGTSDYENVTGMGAFTWVKDDVTPERTQTVDAFKDPVGYARQIVQNFRMSAGHYGALMNPETGMQSVGVIFDKTSGMVYTTWNGYYNNRKTNNTGEEKYMPKTYENEYGFNYKKIDFTGIGKHGLTHDGKYDATAFITQVSPDYSKPGVLEETIKDMDVSSGVQEGMYEGLKDTRPTKEQIATQKGIADEKQGVLEQANTSLTEATTEKNSSVTDKDVAQNTYDSYVKAEKVAQDKVIENTTAVELAREKFGEKSAEYQTAKKALDDAKAELQTAQDNLNAVPGVDQVDHSKVDAAQQGVDGKTKEVETQNTVVAETNAKLKEAENEKAGADAQMAEANRGFEKETKAVTDAESGLEKAQEVQRGIESDINSNEAAQAVESEKIITEDQKAKKAEAEVPALQEGVKKAEAVEVDTTARDAAKAESDKAEGAYNKTKQTEAAASAKVDKAQGTVNETNAQINSIDQNQDKAKSEVESAKKELIDAAKNAGVEPEL
ncbi:hypothetical protein [Actinotignum urinale]|uniref:SCP domain-containing protein n=1 Tax=Actinotignum urinale TaxID=190146 RepID=A0ABU5G8W4_9ACTO|nr:hypothetical protein [Actinotignum urinale]MDY5133379.1 hypothetical protein [Actinotignum urinale]